MPARQAGSVASPCINLCQMDGPTGWCRGCLRTLDEIAAWGRLDDDGRRSVLLRLPARRAAAPQDWPVPAARRGRNA